MYRKLTPKEAIYDIDIEDINIRDNNVNKEYIEVLSAVRTALSINKEGYNIYIIDDCAKEKIEKLINYVQYIYKGKKGPKDICYVSDNNLKHPKVIFLYRGYGSLFKKLIEEVKELYLDITFDFYNNSVSKEKEEILDTLGEKRDEYIDELIDIAKDKGFYMKAIHNGFTFIPIKDGKEMTESEYDDLGDDNKKDILNKISDLKTMSKKILEELKVEEETESEKIKGILKDYYEEKVLGMKNKYRILLENNLEAINFLNDVCEGIEKDIIDNYTMNYDDDENNINTIIDSYKVNVLVDNTSNNSPVCIFEEDPSVYNLIGSIEYENRNGVYSTDVNLIRSGALLRANEGCLILRVSSLLTNASSYYYLKKTLLTGKIDFNYNRGYLELLSLSGLKPESIPVNVKIILIGDYQTFDALYRYDEDFKKLFRIKEEYYPIKDINDEVISLVIQEIDSISKKEEVNKLKPEAIKEVLKYLSRIIDSKNKMYHESNELNRIITLADVRSKAENREYIEDRDIKEVCYKEDMLEKKNLKSYKEKKQFISLKGRQVGQVNGLSVIDGEYFKFGKPIRITCSCYSGSGNVFDVQKESNLSGNIHGKSVNILKGFISSLFGGYDGLPVDFHLSFEQLYGYLEGDSASIAEVVAMISSLSKIPIKQNIAVTGSIDQLGRVQPIGGVNEKIEGFFKVCKELDEIKDKGVIIPESNMDNLVLCSDVEKAILEEEFSIYTVENIFDVLQILLEKDEEEISFVIEKEFKKYTKGKKTK
ncbi:AAA family ATPase [Haloimpatiens sp. FM7315]|uniref:AAA family ATPase n=1 Tax=Haloimpatiens sp. FM7315 TaxID=3298609 RepID=UPI00370CCE58